MQPLQILNMADDNVELFNGNNANDLPNAYFQFKTDQPLNTNIFLLG